jgi:hypothetical protein
MAPTIWQTRFRRMLILGLTALMGFALIIPPVLMDAQLPVPLTIAGLILAFPGVIYCSVVVIWHWKTRYRGRHSDLWGALLLLETTGWFKLIYVLRHILPDARGTGRYVDVKSDLS